DAPRWRLPRRRRGVALSWSRGLVSASTCEGDPVMPKIEVSRSVNAPPATVFEMLTDLEGAPRRIPAIQKIEMLTPGPVGVGTRFRETRVMFGREASETMEFVAFEPGRSYTVTAFSCGTR